MAVWVVRDINRLQRLADVWRWPIRVAIHAEINHSGGINTETLELRVIYAAMDDHFAGVRHVVRLSCPDPPGQTACSGNPPWLPSVRVISALWTGICPKGTWPAATC